MIQNTIEILEGSKKFIEFKKENKDAYLVHVFFLLDEINKDIVQIGYFNKATNKITTFIVEKNSITRNPEADVLKEQETVIKEIDISRVKIELENAIKIADKIHDKKYSKIGVFKKIAILQHLPIGQVWNVTYVLADLKTLNIKIDSENGRVLQESLSSFIKGS